MHTFIFFPYHASFKRFPLVRKIRKITPKEHVMHNIHAAKEEQILASDLGDEW